jgi:CRP-like cAMP-binding protein
MEIKQLKYIVLYFIFCREIILSKKQFNSINEYIDYTYLNSPMHLSCNLDNICPYKEQFTLFQYFEITKKKQGDTFGELALQHDDNQRTATIITLSDTVLGYLTKNDYNLSLSDIELKKRKKDVNFIMSFSIFSQMNWYVFENKYFNFFKKESFLKGEKIMVQGEKNKKLYFIMDGQFEITTSLTLKKLYYLLKFKMGNNFDIKEKPTRYKKFNLRLYISFNKDILGLNDCYISNGLSFVDATCISGKSTLLTLDISILNELREKNPEIGNDLKKLIEKKENVMIERLKMIYYKSIESFKIFKIERNSKSSFERKRM